MSFGPLLESKHHHILNGVSAFANSVYLVSAASVLGRAKVRHLGFCRRRTCTGLAGEKVPKGDGETDVLADRWSTTARNTQLS